MLNDQPKTLSCVLGMSYATKTSLGIQHIIELPQNIRCVRLVLQKFIKASEQAVAGPQRFQVREGCRGMQISR